MFKLRHILNKYFKPHALVLMYHRVAKLESDVWELAVSPDHFEQQLQLLKACRKVVPLNKLVEGIKSNTLKSNSIAITFDDGYADNYQVAKPLLEKYQLPATFFITSATLDKIAEFWWDELEHLILFSKKLPPYFNQSVATIPVFVNLLEEAHLSDDLYQLHCSWKATKQDQPSRRSMLFLKLWQLLKPLSAQRIQKELEHIRNWAGLTNAPRENYRCMTGEQLQELAQHKLFAIGAHTASHIALGSHEKEYQHREIVDNRKLLQEITGNNVTLLSYPYGNYNSETITLAADLGFAGAFTTEEKTITHKSPLYQLGRFQVPDLATYDFERALRHWALNS